MSEKPIVLGPHFALEIAALVALGFWAWTTQEGVARWVAVIGLPELAAVAWSVFRAPADAPDAMRLERPRILKRDRPPRFPVSR